MKTKVIYFNDILEGPSQKVINPESSEDEQTDFENIIQKIQILGDKIYMWNENVFRILEIKYTVDLKQQIETDAVNINLLDSIFLSRDVTSLEKYKQIKNMDFENYSVKSVIETDKVLIYNKFEKAYYSMVIDSTSCSAEEKYFDSCKTLLTRYNFEFNPRDDLTLMPLELQTTQVQENVNSRYILMNHTT